jgi:hypothetical protein
MAMSGVQGGQLLGGSHPRIEISCKICHYSYNSKFEVNLKKCLETIKHSKQITP